MFVSMSDPYSAATACAIESVSLWSFKGSVKAGARKKTHRSTVLFSEFAQGDACRISLWPVLGVQEISPIPRSLTINANMRSALAHLRLRSQQLGEQLCAVCSLYDYVYIYIYSCSAKEYPFCINQSLNIWWKKKLWKGVSESLEHLSFG